MPEASHVYRRTMNQEIYDPSRGRTFYIRLHFYTYTNPPGLGECQLMDAGGITYL